MIIINMATTITLILLFYLSVLKIEKKKKILSISLLIRSLLNIFLLRAITPFLFLQIERKRIEDKKNKHKLQIFMADDHWYYELKLISFSFGLFV